MNFDEKVFIYSLSSRPQDARKFAQTFKPEWLDTAEYVPILNEIYSFTRDQDGEPPSLVTLHKIFKEKDSAAYDLRYKTALDEIGGSVPDRSSILYCLDQARSVGIVRDFITLTNSQTFKKQQIDYNGDEIIGALHSFFMRHGESNEDITLDLKQAVEMLVEGHGFTPPTVRIPCGIQVIDTWTGGGLRTKQLGIIMAPTGSGKSACLVVMAHKIAAIERKNVWLITNELTWGE